MAHGLVQGGISSVSGGDFLSGFLAGAFSSGVGSFTDQLSGLWDVGFWSEKGGSQLLYGMISGGIGSAIGGGNFWMGAATGLIVVGFNHLAKHLEAKAEANKRYLTAEERQKIAANYPGKDKYPDAESVYKEAGGEIYKDWKDGKFNDNTCAIRLSVAFEKSGIDIGGDYNGAKGLKYYASADRIKSAIINRFYGTSKGYNNLSYGVVIQANDKGYSDAYHVDIRYLNSMGAVKYGNQMYLDKFNIYF